jgi:hypothetical protein
MVASCEDDSFLSPMASLPWLPVEIQLLIFCQLCPRSLSALELTCRRLRSLLVDDETAWRSAYMRMASGTHVPEFDGILSRSLLRLWHDASDPPTGDVKSDADADAPFPASLLWRWLTRARFCRLPPSPAPTSACYEVGCRIALVMTSGTWFANPKPSAALLSACIGAVVMCGAWHDGVLDGPGIVQALDLRKGRTDTYVGDLVRGVPDGEGLAHCSEGHRYRGEIRSGRFCGAGALFMADGTRCSGTFAHGFQHGYGVQIYPNGARYVGQLVGGQRHGRGVYEFASSPSPMAAMATIPPIASLGRPNAASPGVRGCVSIQPPPFVAFHWPSAAAAATGMCPSAAGGVGQLSQPMEARPPTARWVPDAPIPSAGYLALPPPVLAEMIDRHLLLSFGRNSERLDEGGPGRSGERIRARKEGRPHRVFYEGGWRSGEHHGWGVMNLPGGVFSGQFVEGRRQGMFWACEHGAQPVLHIFEDDELVAQHIPPPWMRGFAQSQPSLPPPPPPPPPTPVSN